MMLYQYQWDLEGGKTIKKIKQFYKDLFNSSAEIASPSVFPVRVGTFT